VSWPDIFVFLTLVIGFWAGYRSGFFREASVLAALFLGLLVAGYLAGVLAAMLVFWRGLSPAALHLIAYWLLFLFVFAAVRALGYLLERIQLPSILGFISRICGGLVSCLKAAFALWLILFVALFFPMDKDVRAALRASPSARAIDSVNPGVNDVLEQATPALVRPLAALVLKHHRL
jgi:membrane protein required for colicin V production